MTSVSGLHVSERLRRRWARLRQDGLARSVRGWLDIATLSALRPLFGFHPWHATSPTSRRPYRRDLARLANDLMPTCVVEVGCGLGAILARITAPTRVGYDVDSGVIRAARALRSRRIDFRVGGFDDVSEPTIDLLIAVNWIHDFAPDQLDRWLTPLLGRTRYLLVDLVERSSPLAYNHFHDFAFLRGRAEPIRVEAFGEEHRRFVLLAVNR